MPLTQLAPPYPIFTDKNGDPLDAGYLYFGTANLNPETNPIQVYWDNAFTQPAAQPIRTINGYPSRNGSPTLIYADSQFSVTVRNKSNELVIYSPVGYGIVPGTAATNTDQMTYNEGSTGAVDRVLTSRLQDYVSVKDFGAVGNGVTDDTAAIQAAVDAITPTGGAIYFPVPGIYKVTAQINVTSNHAVTLYSEMGPDNTANPDSYISIGGAIAGAVFNVSARGGSIRGLWFRDPTSVVGVSQGTSAVNAALKLSVFGMGKVIDCAFDGILGSAIEVDGMIRGHIVRPHIRDCGTPTKPALWLNPQVSLGAGQITIDAPHIETCYGEYLYVGQNAADTKIVAGQFEADTAIAATCKNFIYNYGDRTNVIGCGFNRNTATEFYGLGNRAIISGCYFNAASGIASDPRINLQGAYNQVSGCRFAGTSADTGTSIQDVGGNNVFEGCYVYFGGNVILGENTVWTGGGCFDLKTTQAYCIEGATSASVIGAHISGADVAGGVKAVGGMTVSGCNVIGNAGIGIRCETSTAVIVGNRSTGNTGGNFSFTGYPHGYETNTNFSGDGVYPLQASDTWAPGLIANGASASRTITVTGAAAGDVAQAQFPMIAAGSGVAGMQISASVTSSNTVRVSISNLSGAPVTLDSGTLVVKAVKQ